MLAAIETEHLNWGDSVNLSAAYVEKMLEQEPDAPASKRGMGITLISLIQKYGVVGYDAMRTVDTPAPRWVFMLGAVYTPQEFARSVCAPGEYVAYTPLSGVRRQASGDWGGEVELDVDDNWLHSRFVQVPVDTLLKRTERAVRQGHGVCWESSSHAMAIVGLGHDPGGRPGFVLKNSWGQDQPHGGLVFLSYDSFIKKTLAVTMTRQAFSGHESERSF
jgi:bleomycin hydrolase